MIIHFLAGSLYETSFDLREIIILLWKILQEIKSKCLPDSGTKIYETAFEYVRGKNSHVYKQTMEL